MKTENTREEVGEEASGFSRERAFGFHPSKLCWKSARARTAESENV